MKKYPDSIAASVILLTITTILSRATGFIREIIFAGQFGFNKEFEIYLIAAVIPVLINTAINYLAQNYFIPVYNRFKEIEERTNYLRNQFWLFFIIGALGSISLFLLKNHILEIFLEKSDESVFNLASNILTIYLLSFPLNAGYSILSAYLQAELKFRHPAFSQLILNLPIIILVLFFSDSLMIYAIPIGYVAGSMLQLLYLLIIAGPGFLKMNFRKPGSMLLHSFNWSLVLVILIEVVNQLHPFIDRYYYSEVQTGGIAALNYASVLFGLPITVFSFALASVVFPILSKHSSSDSPEKSEIYYNKALSIIAALFTPVMLMFLFNGDTIISLIFQRGQFGPNDTQMTFQVLKMYSVSLVFFAGYAVINKMIFSSGLLKHLLILSLLSIGIKILMNNYLVRDHQQNGLAFSSAINFMILCIAGYYLVFRKTGAGKQGLFFKEVIIYFCMGITAIYVSGQIVSLVASGSVLGKLFQIILFCILYLLSLLFLTDKLDFIYKKKAVLETNGFFRKTEY